MKNGVIYLTALAPKPDTQIHDKHSTNGKFIQCGAVKIFIKAFIRSRKAPAYGMRNRKRKHVVIFSKSLMRLFLPQVHPYNLQEKCGIRQRLCHPVKLWSRPIP